MLSYLRDLEQVTSYSCFLSKMAKWDNMNSKDASSSHLGPYDSSGFFFLFGVVSRISLWCFSLDKKKQNFSDKKREIMKRTL